MRRATPAARRRRATHRDARLSHHPAIFMQKQGLGRRGRAAVLLLGALLLAGMLWALAPHLARTTADAEERPWNLALVNANHPLPEDFSVETVEAEDGVSVDARAAQALRELLAACRAAGHEPFLRSGFRTRAEQQKVMDAKVEAYEDEGLWWPAAQAEARKWVAEPGTSEHELGLAVDINDAEDGGGVYAWLAEHAHEHGFVQRYPEDKADVTGISHEPWHYRYVGVQAATEMHEQGLVLEEYLE